MTLIIRLLGPIDICRQKNPVAIRGYKPLALLAYLLVTGQPHTRQHLIDLLFDDSGDPRGSLRWTLAELRRAVGAEYLLVDRQQVAFNFESDFWFDVPHFEAGQTGLYRGDFLEGLAVRAAYGFEDWLFYERERFRNSYRAALTGQLQWAESRDDTQAVIDTAFRLLRLDNLQEAGYLALMRAYARLGQREAALAQFERCRQVLKAELHTEPAAETIALFEQIRTGVLQAAPSSPREPVAAQPQSPAFLQREETIEPAPRFVARRRELAQLDGHFKATLAGRGRVVFVIGEAGSGKTAMLAEFARRAQATYPDLVVAGGQGNAFAGPGDPYLPFREVLAMLSGDVESRWAAGAVSRYQARCLWNLAPSTIQALLAVGPDLIDVFVPGASLLQWAANVSAEPGWLARLKEVTAAKQARRGGLEQHSLFEQYAQVLETLAARQPLLMLLDDLQWLDRASINLLFHLGRRLTGSRILFLGAYRPSEVVLGRLAGEDNQGQQPALEAVIYEFKRYFGPIQVELAATTPVEEREFVNDWLDSEPNRLDEPFREAVVRRTQGHPLFTVELVRDLQERGHLIRDEAGQWIEGPALDWASLPARVEAVIEQRLGRLDEITREMLAVASVEGQEFTAQLVAQVQQLDELLLLRQLSQEVEKRHGLVRERGEVQVGERRLTRYQFSHTLFRDYLYNGLGQGERRLLHHQVAAALEDLYGGHTADLAGPLARHYVAAGQADKAVDYLLLAGDLARRLYAYQEAIAYYEQALALLRQGDNASRERAARVLMKLGLTYHSALDFERSRQAYEEGFDLWRQAGELYRPAVSLPPAPHALRVGWLEPATVDPTLSADYASASVINQLFSGLAAHSPEMDVVPDIARGWEVLAGGCTYLFHLRHDVRWSDGAAVTAADFEYAWKRALDPALQSPAASLLFDVKGARAFHQGELADPGQVGVRALDDLTLRVELAGPTAYFPHLLTMPPTYPVPRHIVAAHGQAWTKPENIVTNGPFLLEAWYPGEALVLRRNPAYHGQFRGNLERIEVYDMTVQRSWLDVYAQNKLDILHFLLLPLSQLPLLRRRYAEEYLAGPWLQTFYVLFDVGQPPFNDVRVRRAFTLATDRDTLANIVRKGYEFPATGGLVPPGLPGHLDNIGLPYDPEQAQDLLAAAGYPGGRGFPPIRALVAEGEAFITAGDWLQAEWQKILGVQISWERVKMSSWPDRLGSEKPWLVLYGWVADYPDPDSFLRVCMQQDLVTWQNEAFVRLVAAARQSLDQQERVKLYQAADRILIEEAALLPLLYGRLHLLLKPWLTQFPLSPLSWWFWKDVIIEPPL